MTVTVTVSSGQTYTVSSGETDINDTVVSGGILNVLSGGTIINTADSYVIYLSGGTASGTTINSGGSEQVLSGSTASGTTVLNGGEQDVRGGAAINTTISGGVEVVRPYGGARRH